MSTSHPSVARPLRATYRLQLTPEFNFASARDLVPYLATLGISHLYLSPSLQAQEGSTHGYDVADPSSLSRELGGEDAFRALAAAAHAAGLGIILDVVPNHMAASEENRYWADPELRERFFDIDPVSGKWRRFFDIDELAAVRVERDEVFTATHEKVLALVTEGLVDGLRVDHPDGLADPQGYLQRLADAGVARVWVEKILGVDERLPEGWPVSGTVGYEFLNDLVALSANPAAEAPLTQLWEEIAADTRPFGAWALEAKLEQARGTFSAEVDRLVRVPGSAGDAAAVALALASQPVYRSYIPTEAGEFLTRFQQTSPAVMAKGVEDTAFYRYCRLLALNEVGGEPGRFSLSVEAFHAHNAERALQFPEALLTTMTHDAKRSADARARILALSWSVEAWTSLVRAWIGWGEGPDAIDRLFILQTLVGVWEIDWERIDAYLEKALREAKRHSTWIEPDEAYEAGAKAWARELLAQPDFRRDFDALLADVRRHGAQISQAWVALKLLSPGVPDIYQGDELEFLALVDPDNRRPVDWEERRRQIESPEDPKLGLIRDLLALRARHPEAFGPGAAYVALPADPGTVAFRRGDAVEVRV
ncbi:MAG TPA: alpha-amylase family glycosyl hydrolase, partial [Solirubrobacteraceae bacterium]|nr:alpha-amylase family glycosyl hydrolase [Solirubrobacteraceae bacterium]